MDMQGYQDSFDKLWGYANVVRFGTEHLPDHGCIVLVSGTPAKRPRPGQISLASVGASVEHLTKSLAAELAPRRINCVSPGIIGAACSCLPRRLLLTPLHPAGRLAQTRRSLARRASSARRT